MNVKRCMVLKQDNVLTSKNSDDEFIPAKCAF